MTTSKRSTRWTVAVVVAAVLACMVLGLFFGPRYFQRGQDYLGRPLVLIHSPANGERLPFGQMVPAIALARSEAGITRMELWAEGKVIASQEAPAGETLSPMTLAAAWNPTTLGPHRVTVRAFTARGLGGYASRRCRGGRRSDNPRQPHGLRRREPRGHRRRLRHRAGRAGGSEIPAFLPTDLRPAAS